MCVNCNDSLQVNLPVAPSGLNGTDGDSAYVYIASATDTAGSGFTYPAVLDPPATLPGRYFISIINTTAPLTNPVVGDFGTFTRVVGINGATGATGAAGTNGADGVNGAISLNYKWSNDTSASAPAVGFVKTSNANITLSSALYINLTDANTTAVGNVLAQMLTSTSTTKSIISITAKGDPTTFAHFSVTGGTVLSGTYYILTVTGLNASATTPFTLNDDVIFSFSVVGDIGSTGATGPAGPQGPQGPAGSSIISRPSTNNIDISGSNAFNTTVDTTADGTFYNYATSAGSAGQLNADNATPASATVIYINRYSDSSTADYWSTFRYVSSTFFSANPSQLLSITDITSGDDASYWIRRAIWNGGTGILTLYVTYTSGALASFTLGNDLEVLINTDLQVELSNISYNRVNLENTSLTSKVVRFKAPIGSTPGETLLVEAIAATGNAQTMNLGYVYNSTGSYNTLIESWEYANRPSDGTLSPSPTNLSLLNAGESCLMQFLVTPTGLAFIGGDKFVR